MMRRTFAVVLLVTAAVGCSESTAPPAFPRATLLAVQVDSVSVDARLQVSVSAPSAVQVTYTSAPDLPLLEVRSDVSPADGSLALTRLVAGRVYSFTARAMAADGSLGPAHAGAFTTPPLPDDLRQVELSASGTPSQPLMMLEVVGTAGFNGFVAVDARGDVVWRWRTQGAPQGWTRRANGNFVLNDLGQGLFEVSPAGEVVRELDFDFFGPTPHHDVIATPQNTLLFISQDFRTPPGMPTIWGEAIYEWSPETGAITKRWTAWDWYDPARDWSDRSTPLDWLHGNSLAIGTHGNVLLSLNWLSQVVSISPDWKGIEWKLGGEGSSFAVDADAEFSGQHSVTMPADGRVLMFDNGRARSDGRQFSRALELVIDTAAHTARKAWEWQPATPMWAPYVGLTRRLANGNTTVFFGLPAGFRGATGPVASYEVQPNGGVAWSLVVGGVTSVYRGAPLETVGGERSIP
jgi:hypothetical protein